jgi:hypothetical protein
MSASDAAVGAEDAVVKPRRQPLPIVVTTVGAPARLGGFAALLQRLRERPPVSVAVDNTRSGEASSRG